MVYWGPCVIHNLLLPPCQVNLNSRGAHRDEEYRMLRQNLFERFGAGSQVPIESPVVKLSPPDNRKFMTAKVVCH